MRIKRNEVDWIFKDQARLGEAVFRYTAEDWRAIERWIKEHMWDGIDVAAAFKKRVPRMPRVVTSEPYELPDPRTQPLQDGNAKLEAIKRFSADGYTHPEKLPGYYEEAIVRDHAIMEEMFGNRNPMRCPSCGSNKYKVDDDKSRRLGFSMVTGKVAYHSIFTCVQCGRVFHQEDCEGHEPDHLFRI